MKRGAEVTAVKNASQPVDLVGRLKEWMGAENVRVLTLDDIVNFADSFAGDVPDGLDMLRDEQQAVRVNVS